jgi:hypothetical protein
MQARLRLVVGGAAQLAADIGTLRPRIQQGAAPMLFAFAEGRGVSLIAPPAEEARSTAGFTYRFCSEG